MVSKERFYLFVVGFIFLLLFVLVVVSNFSGKEPLFAGVAEPTSGSERVLVKVCTDSLSGGTYTCNLSEECCKGTCTGGSTGKQCCRDYLVDPYVCGSGEECCEGACTGGSTGKRCCRNEQFTFRCNSSDECCGFECAGESTGTICCRSSFGPELDYKCKVGESCCGDGREMVCTGGSTRKICCNDSPDGISYSCNEGETCCAGTCTGGSTGKKCCDNPRHACSEDALCCPGLNTCPTKCCEGSTRLGPCYLDIVNPDAWIEVCKEDNWQLNHTFPYCSGPGLGCLTWLDSCTGRRVAKGCVDSTCTVLSTILIGGRICAAVFFPLAEGLLCNVVCGGICPLPPITQPPNPPPGESPNPPPEQPPQNP